MIKLGFTGLALLAALVAPRSSKALLTDEDLDKPLGPITAYGTCVYHDVILELDCYEDKGCTVQVTRNLQGKPIVYPQDLCPPMVAYKRGQILYCMDQPAERCFTPPPEDKCKEKISLDCLCC